MFLEIESYTEKDRRDSRYAQLKEEKTHDLTEWSSVERIGSDFVNVWFVAYKTQEEPHEN